MKEFPHNLKDVKPKWNVIYEESTHNIPVCKLNRKNKTNYQIVYQTQVANHTQQSGRN